MDPVRIVYESGEARTEEKKSKFIAVVVSVHSEEEAAAFLAQKKKQYWDASHNCWAYVIGDRQQLQRCSDDGEPQGTAGRPILEVMLSEHVSNAMIVVTRYFGGTLLGTGGLVRAYSHAAAESLHAGIILQRTQGLRLQIGTDYSGLGKIQYLLANAGIPIMDTVYTEAVVLTVVLEKDRAVSLKNEITEATGARAEFLQEEDCIFGIHDGRVILLEEQA